MFLLLTSFKSLASCDAWRSSWELEGLQHSSAVDFALGALISIWFGSDSAGWHRFLGGNFETWNIGVLCFSSSQIELFGVGIDGACSNITVLAQVHRRTFLSLLEENGHPPVTWIMYDKESNSEVGSYSGLKRISFLTSGPYIYEQPVLFTDNLL